MKARGSIKIAGIHIPEEDYTPERLIAESEKIRLLTIEFIVFAKTHLGMTPDAAPGDATLTAPRLA